MTKRMGVGQFFAWEGGCLFIGHHDRQLPLHSHQAIQLVVASEGDHRVRGSDSEPWSTCSIAAIASKQPHALDVTASDYGAVIFVEPETREGRAITQRCTGAGITEVGTSALREISGAMFDAWLNERKDETVANTRRLVATLGAGVDRWKSPIRAS